MAPFEVLKRWDIVVLLFPYIDRHAEKRRPAVVVSTQWLHRTFSVAWLAMITSAGNKPWACDVAIADLAGAGLPAPSVVRPAKIATVDVQAIVRTIGRLPLESIGLVQAFLAQAATEGQE